MSDRRTLHLKSLPAFAAWLERIGYEVVEPKGMHEVFRAKKMNGGKDTVVIYRRDRASQHLSVMDKDMRLVRRFLRDRKERSE